MTSIEAADDSGVSRTASLNAGEPRGGNAIDYNSSVDGRAALRRPQSGMLLGKQEQFLELLGQRTFGLSPCGGCASDNWTCPGLVER
jgi:hypothetical protein